MKSSEIETIQKLYQAHADPALYKSALDAFSAPFPGIRTLLHVEGWEDRVFSLSSVYWNLSFEEIQEAARLSHLNPLLSERDVKRFGRRLFSSLEYVSQQEVRKSEYYDIVLRPKDELDMAYAFTVIEDMKSFFGFSATVPAGYSEADRAELEGAMERIRPHVQRSFQIAREIMRRTAHDQAGLLIEQIGTPVAVFDEAHRLIAQNIRAETFFGQNDVLSLSSNGIIIARDKATDDCLRVASARVISNLISVGPVRVLREGRSRLFLYFVPVAGYEGFNPLVRPFIEGFPAYLVYILDPDDVDPAPRELLVKGMGLSGAEARLAMLLHEGVSVKEAAERSAITYATARNQLASITRKLDLTRQSELAALLARITARMPR